VIFVATHNTLCTTVETGEQTYRFFAEYILRSRRFTQATIFVVDLQSVAQLGQEFKRREIMLILNTFGKSLLAQVSHKQPQQTVDHIALRGVRALRWSFDVLAGFKTGVIDEHKCEGYALSAR